MTLRAATLNQTIAPPVPLEPEGTFEAFYDATSAQAYGLAYFITEDVPSAEAACQAAYMDHWRTEAPTARETFAERQSRLMGAVRRESVTVRPLTGSPQGPMQAALFSDSQETRAIRTAYQGLAEEERRAVTLVYFGGMNVAQAAATMTQPVADLRACLRNALLTLSTRLAL